MEKSIKIKKIEEDKFYYSGLKARNTNSFTNVKISPWNAKKRQNSHYKSLKIQTLRKTKFTLLGITFEDEFLLRLLKKKKKSPENGNIF